MRFHQNKKRCNRTFLSTTNTDLYDNYTKQTYVIRRQIRQECTKERTMYTLTRRFEGHLSLSLKERAHGVCNRRKRERRRKVGVQGTTL